MPRRAGFTLIEILIVVVILGILAAIVIPQFTDASEDASRSAFVTSIRTFGRGAMLYRAETGQHLEDSSSGQMPAGAEDYLDGIKWTAATPLGGVWDAELNSYGITSALGVHFNGGLPSGIDDAAMGEIDSIIDDGDLGTGSFRKLADDRFYLVLVD